jgi:hypothetical protein
VVCREVTKGILDKEDDVETHRNRDVDLQAKQDIVVRQLSTQLS